MTPAATLGDPRASLRGSTAPVTGLLDSLHVGMGWHDEQPGGLNRMVANLLRHLPEAGVGARALVAGSPAVASLSNGRALSFAGLDAPLPRRCWHARQAVRAAVRSRPPDLVASHFPLFGLAARGAVGALPLVVHFHGPWASEGAAEGGGGVATAAKRWVERRACAGARRYIALSRAFAQLLERDLGVDPDLVRVIPGGVDCERFRPAPSRTEARAALGLPTDRPIVVTVRRLARRMGLPELVTAFAAVRQRVPEASLVIGGAGPLMEPLRAGRRVRARPPCPPARAGPRRPAAGPLPRGRPLRGAVDGAGGLRPDHGRIARRRDAGAGVAGGRAARDGARPLQLAGATRDGPERLGPRSRRRLARHPAPAHA